MQEIDKQVSTEFEDLFFNALCKRLSEQGFNGEVHKNVLMHHDSSTRCPDIYIPKAGLIIEVDGKIHHSNLQVMQNDETRINFLKRLGLDIYTMEANWIGNSYRLNRAINEIVTWVMTKPRTRQEIRSTERKLSRGRPVLKTNYPNQMKNDHLRVSNKLYGLPFHTSKWSGGIKVGRFHLC